MFANFDQLIDRVHQLAALTQRLRDENRSLRQQLAEKETESRLMRERLDTARARIEGLIKQLPAEK